MNQINLKVLCVAFMWFHNVAGLDFRVLPYPEEATMSTGSVITSYGYPLEIHYVTTKDGYILKVHRIPFGPHCKDNTRRKPYPIIAIHGLFSSSKQFAITRKGLAFLAADDCYDVWLPNTRGNYESRNHTFLDPNGTEFWEFGFYEKAVYDVPAVIEYALLETNASQIQYVGHSEATTIAFILSSLYPEYSEELIRSVHALSPAAFTRKSRTVFTIIAPFLPFVQKLLHKFKIVEIPRVTFLQALSTTFPCRLQAPVALNPCAQLVFSIFGHDEQQFNVTSLMIGGGFAFGGASVRELLLGAQWKKSGKFARYNFYDDNEKVYGQPTPPEYPIGNIRIPIYLYVGNNDTAADPGDVKEFYELAPTAIWVDNSEFKEFSHIDFIIGNDVDIVNRKVLENIALNN